MWNGKIKAVTFSFDDGVTQDIALIKLLNKYGIKATFNLNSSLLGLKNRLVRNGRRVLHNKIVPRKVADVYRGHEVAAHTLTHADLITADEDTVVWQVEKDREVLSSLVGYEVKGLAYPNGGVNNDERVAEIIKNKTGVKYARTITSTYSFDLQSDLFRFNPTVYWIEDCLYEVIDRFIALKPRKPQILYIWGHSYEIDAGYVDTVKFENALKKLSEEKDIFFGTNKEVLL
ncbi:MAG: polysaccharide deacetylase family protein [Clostridia bacterium]|nr:polysaccharide deacetylase family protein [Clostridia bacterium]